MAKLSPTELKKIRETVAKNWKIKKQFFLGLRWETEDDVPFLTKLALDEIKKQLHSAVLLNYAVKYAMTLEKLMERLNKDNLLRRNLFIREKVISKLTVQDVIDILHKLNHNRNVIK